MSAGHKTLHVPGGRIALKNGRRVGKTGGMGQQMMRGEGPMGRVHGNPGNILEHRTMEIEFSLLVHWQQNQSDERFADGADLKKVFRGSGSLQVKVGKAIARG